MRCCFSSKEPPPPAQEDMHFSIFWILFQILFLILSLFLGSFSYLLIIQFFCSVVCSIPCWGDTVISLFGMNKVCLSVQKYNFILFDLTLPLSIFFHTTVTLIPGVSSLFFTQTFILSILLLSFLHFHTLLSITI